MQLKKLEQFSSLFQTFTKFLTADVLLVIYHKISLKEKHQSVEAYNYKFAYILHLKSRRF